MSDKDKPAQDTPARTASQDAGSAADTDKAKKATKAARKRPRKAAAKKAPAREAPAEAAAAGTAHAQAAADAQAPAAAAKPPRKAKKAKKAKSPARAAGEAARQEQAPAPTRDEAATPAPAAQPQPDPPSRPPHPLIRVPMPVRWRDLDAFNHVNNSKYLSYLEEARLQWMLGVPGMGMDEHVAPVVAAAQLAYRRPITWPAGVVIELFVERLGRTSLTVGHRIVDAKDPEVLFCDGHVVMVWIDRDSGAAAPLPDSVRRACSD